MSFEKLDWSPKRQILAGKQSEGTREGFGGNVNKKSLCGQTDPTQMNSSHPLGFSHLESKDPIANGDTGCRVD